MQKTCFQHECLKKKPCRHKSKFNSIILCLNDKKCRHKSLRPYGRYALEDTIQF